MTMGAQLAHGRRAALAFAAALLAATAHAQPASPDQRAAIGAAERWLARVDAQRYADAWSMGAESFKSEVDRKRWDDGIRGLRRERGARSRGCFRRSCGLRCRPCRRFSRCGSRRGARRRSR